MLPDRKGEIPTNENPLGIGLPGGAPFVTLPFSQARTGAMQVLDVMRQTMAPVTVVTEVDASRVKALREAYKDDFQRRTGIPLTYTPFFARAAVKALQACPIMNATLTPHGYVIPRHIHLGIAAQAPGTVVIPAVRNAERKDIPTLAYEIFHWGQRARAGQVRPADMADSTFVITNTGRYATTLFGTPTIKPPNVGILAFEAIIKRPVVTADDRIAARPMMYLALTADHRAVDGSDMTAFIGKVKEVLETASF